MGFRMHFLLYLRAVYNICYFGYRNINKILMYYIIEFCYNEIFENCIWYGNSVDEYFERNAEKYII